MIKPIIIMMMLGLLSSTILAQDSSQNLIVNGDFSQTGCTASYCIYTDSSLIQGWIPDPQLQVGFGYVYSDYLQNQRVAELAPNKNSCIKQQLRYLDPGCYQLTFEYAARKGRTLDDSQFNVSMNGNLLRTITPCDYQVHSQTVQVQVNNGCGAEVRFCGTGGEDNSYGVVIKSVKLIKQPSYISIPSLQVNIKPIVIDVNIPILTPPVLTPPVINPPVYSPPAIPTVTPPPINIPVLNVPVIPTPTINVSILNPPVLNPPIINPPTLTPPGIYIDSHSNQCYQKQYQLQGGDIEISFDYKIQSYLLLSDSALIVTIDNQPVYKVLPCESGKTITIKVPKLSSGQHTLGFCPSGCPTEPIFTIFVCNVVITETQCIGQWTNDLITNGGFEQTTCTGSYCIWNQQTFQQSFVPGWLPSPQIEIGRGTTYNSALANTWVVELDANSNTCIQQQLNLRTGRHLLTFDWAARSGTSFATNAIDVKLNGQVLKSVAASDYNIHSQNVDFSLTSVPTQSVIEFCGAGISDSYGALLDNVKLVYFDECAQQKINKYC